MNFLSIIFIIINIFIITLKLLDTPVFVNNYIKLVIFALPEFICIFISIFFLIFKKQLIKYLFILSIYSFVILYAVEFSLNIYLKDNVEHKIKSIVTDKKLDYDFRSKKEILMDLRKNDPKVQISISPANWLNNSHALFPLSSISTTKTLYCNEGGKWITYFSDRYGFRNSDDKWDNEVEYILLGDSFTQGGCVENNENISGILDKNNITNLNLGWGGTSLLIQNAILREYLNKINSNKMLMFFYPKNDLLEFRTEMKDIRLIKYFNEKNHNQKLVIRQKGINKYLTNYTESWEKMNKKSEIYKIYQFETLFKVVLKILKQRLENNVKESYFKKLVEMNNWLIEKNIDLTVICIPSYNDFVNAGSNENSCSKYKNDFSKKKIKYVDVFHKLQNQNINDIFPFGLNMHFSPYGYETFVRFFKEEL